MDMIRYFKLKNNGAFVARMQIIWTGDDGKGNESHGVYEPGGYHDICAAAERTIDLCDQTKIPDGSVVQLKVVVVAGKDKKAQKTIKENDKEKKVDETFLFSKDSGSTACYKIGGTTLFNELSLESCK